MKDVRDVRVPLAALAGRLACSADPGFFRFLLRRIGIKDVRVDGTDIVHPSFIPLETLVSETVQEMSRSGVVPVACLVCSTYHDPDRDAGIFEDPNNLSGFVCRSCAESMSAWTYYHDRMRL